GNLWYGPNGRGSNVPAGDISAVVRHPHRIDVFALGAGNTLLHWPGGGLDNATLDPWINWPTNRAKNPVGGRVRPDRPDELVNIVKEAEGRNLGVRAVGSGWSNSDVAMPPAYVVETDRLDSILTDVLSTALNAAAFGMRLGSSGPVLVHVEAGIKLNT